MQIFKRLFCKETKSSAEIALPRQGEAWYIPDESPWPTELTVKILDQRNGWVRYDMGGAFRDERMEVERFMKIYKFLNPINQGGSSCNKQ